MATLFITERIPMVAEEMLRAAGHTVIVSEKEGILTHEELLTAVRTHLPDGIVSLLTNKITKEVFEAAPSIKICANYAVGYDNIQLADAAERNIVVTNTPGVLTDTVAEFTVALIFALAKRIPEADVFTRSGKYVGWGPLLLLGTDLRGKTLGILGAGRIGARVGEILSKGTGMQVVYHDVAPAPAFESVTGAVFKPTPEEVLRESDVVSIHVPLLETTYHLMNAERLSLMKKTAYLINTSRGPVIDEHALVAALKGGHIRGAALDVFEYEPMLSEGLAALPQVIVTPHIASATEETRSKMARMVAENIIAFFKGDTPPHVVQKSA